ncbi:hypothetical protein FB45DRAFT_843274 [Roridomyces roridus]|uniref:Transmembrane protein n=1 Tax=Roridomyces roridus TaxID=1738132 RepID=A0AAD7B7D9_9AGAR|nr:hypothetical protein FB45DRAFT_843274 [Roridomyces roridus]
MPEFVQEIDVNSPLVQYDGPWKLGGADGDPEVVKYKDDTFVYCAGTTCSATLSFIGTEVHVVGAYRTNSGPFQVLLDGKSFGPFGVAVTVVEQFQIDLFNQTNMSSGTHSLTISNLDSNATRPNMNLDYFTWTTDINSLTDLRIQDDSPAFSYEPASAWSVIPQPSSSFPGFDGGGHSTNQAQATTNFSFNGDRVALYGAIGAQGGPIQVQIDNSSTVGKYTTNQMVTDTTAPVAQYLAGQMLFYADHLGSGEHHITVTANPASPAQDLSIDYAVVDGTVNSAAPAASVTPAAPSGPAAASALGTSKAALSSAQVGAIAGGVSLLVVLSLIYLGFTLYRRRRRQSRPWKQAVAAGHGREQPVSFPSFVDPRRAQSANETQAAPPSTSSAYPSVASATVGTESSRSQLPPGYDSLGYEQGLRLNAGNRSGKR